ncbi:hypothetical protein [Candidatus Coxiella mudrowiae]
MGLKLIRTIRGVGYMIEKSLNGTIDPYVFTHQFIAEYYYPYRITSNYW